MFSLLIKKYVVYNIQSSKRHEAYDWKNENSQLNDSTHNYAVVVNHKYSSTKVNKQLLQLLVK